MGPSSASKTKQFPGKPSSASRFTIWMVGALFFFIVCGGIQFGALAQPELEPTPVHFFEGGRRSPVTGSEASFLLEVRRSLDEELRIRGIQRTGLTPEEEAQWRTRAENTKVCSAFFVENEEKKLLVGSARHCFKFAEIPMCNDKTSYDFRPLAAPGLRGQCRRIVALSDRSDFLIFEVEFPGQDTSILRRKMSSLALAVFADVQPSRDLSLEMFGFPGDSKMKNQPTKSFSCEVRSVPQDAPMDDYFENFSRRDSVSQADGLSGSLMDLFRLRARQIAGEMITLRHNCDTYAGNSGGPIVLAGSRLMIGLPASYSRNEQVFPRDKFGLLESPWRLLQGQLEQIKREKIIIKNLDERAQQRLPGPGARSSTQPSAI